MGPVISARVAGQLEEAFDRLTEIEGEVVRNLSVQEEGSAFVSPGIIDMSRVDNVPDEEHFGPLLKIYRVKDFDQAINKANDTRFGLSAGLLSDDEKEMAEVLCVVPSWHCELEPANNRCGGVCAVWRYRRFRQSPSKRLLCR